MGRRVWVYLDRSDAEFLNSIGDLIGGRSDGDRIRFIIKFMRMVAPLPSAIPAVMSRVRVRANGGRKHGRGKKLSYWAYLDEDDLVYILGVKDLLGFRSTSETVRFLIKLARLTLPHLPEAVEAVREELKKESVTPYSQSQPSSRGS